MKKTIATGLALLFIVIAVTAIAGCGGSGDSKQAKQYMQKGDAVIGEINGQASEIESSVAILGQNLSDPAKYESNIQESQTFLKGIMAKGDEAITEYKKIKTLKGVNDYVKYADLMIQDVGYMKEMMSKIVAIMDQALAEVKAGDQAGVVNLLTQVKAETEKVGEQSDAVNTEAQNLKTSKNL